MKKIFKLVIGCLILGSMLFAKEVDVKILGTSDVHGRISPWDYSTDMENYSGGFSQISTLVKKYRETNDNVVLVDLGDAIQDNGIEKFNDIYYKENKHPIMQIYNAMGYDMIVPGNHEFNFGMDFLDRAFDQFNGEILATNIYTKSNGNYYKPSTIVEIEGVKIGIIGVTTPLIEQFEEGTNNLRDLVFRDPIAEIKKEIVKLKNKGVDSIVLLAHMGLPNENNIAGTGVIDIANEISEIDVILAGHYHKNISKKVINGVLITEPYKYGKAISIIDLKFDVTDKKVKLISKGTKTVSIKNVKSDKNIEAIYKRFHEKLRADANIVVGKTKKDLVPTNELKGIPSIYTKDTGLATLFGEVGFYFAKKSGVDVIALSVDQENAKLDMGLIKKKDINYNYRYTGGEITVYEVTGRDLKDYLEWSAAYYNTIKDGDLLISFDLDRRSEKYATYDFAKGIIYDIDIREVSGNRIKNLNLLNGTSIKDNTKIRLGMNSYRMERMLGKGGALEGRTNIKKIWDSKEVYGEMDGTIRYMTMKYIKEIKNGIIDVEASNNWKIIGLPDTKESRLAKRLLNEGKINLHNNGRATNISSITLEDIKK
ncbi:MAG: metallophosphoesterase [Psychrilyobacter sp.]|uniref:bifunctional metallophosphatase/5'-nucleotidase n=1 Tax=Psychrilyobacter sp. TaxID=2586924 RepID=UPI003C71C804